MSTHCLIKSSDYLLIYNFKIYLLRKFTYYGEVREILI